MTGSEVERVRTAYAARTDLDRYDLRRADQVAIHAARCRVWGAALRRLEVAPRRILEVGAGGGTVLRWLQELEPDLCVGVDVQVDRLRTSQQTNPAVAQVAGDGCRLPVRSGSVDVVALSTVVSSILHPDVAGTLVAEVRRALAPSGVVLWFDLFRDNPRNPDVRGVRAREVTALFPGFAISLERVVLVPPLARRLERLPRVAATLEAVPLLRTHLAGALVAPP